MRKHLEGRHSSARVRKTRLMKQPVPGFCEQCGWAFCLNVQGATGRAVVLSAFVWSSFGAEGLQPQTGHFAKLGRMVRL